MARWAAELRDAALRADKNSDLAELTQSFAIKVLHLEDQKSDFTSPSQWCAPSLFCCGSLDESTKGSPEQGFCSDQAKPSQNEDATVRAPPFSSLESDASNGPPWLTTPLRAG